MFKTASRNMSRVSVNTVMGKSGGAKGAPVLSSNESARLTEAVRLARIRRIFQLEGQLEAARAGGASTAALKAELAGVRNGSVDVPLRLARDPKPRRDAAPGVTVDRRRGPERTAVSAPSSGRRRAVSVKGIETDLSDLSKGKLTLSGVAVVKTLLETFSQGDIAEILRAPSKVIDRVAESPLLGLASLLDPDAGMVLVGILERRMREIYPDADQGHSPNTGSESSPKPSVAVAKWPLAVNHDGADRTFPQDKA